MNPGRHLVFASAATIFAAGTASAADTMTLFTDFSNRGTATQRALGGGAIAHPFAKGLGNVNAAAIPVEPGGVSMTLSGETTRTLEANESVSQGFRALGVQVPLPSPAGTFGLGMSFAQRQQTNTISFPDGQNRLQYRVEEYIFAPSLAMQLFDEMTLGATANFNFGSEQAVKTMPDQILEEQDISSITWRLSALGRMGDLSAAASYESSAESETHTVIQPGAGAQLGQPYRPAMLQLGLAYDLPEVPLVGGQVAIVLDVLLTAQVDYAYLTNATNGRIVRRPGAQLRNNVYAQYSPAYAYSLAATTPEAQDLDRGEYVVPRAGAEALLFRALNLQGKLRVGTWREPIVGFPGQTQWHLTHGYVLAGWGFEAALSVDSTRESNDLALDVGLDLKL